MIKLIRLDRILGDRKQAGKWASYELICDLRDRGQVLPILVRPIPRTGLFWFFKKQYYELIDGFQRVNGAFRLGWKTIVAQISCMTDDQILEASIIASTPYVPTPPAQYKAALKRILEIHPEMTREQLAHKIGWTLERINKVLDNDDLRDLQ